MNEGDENMVKNLLFALVVLIYSINDLTAASMEIEENSLQNDSKSSSILTQVSADTIKEVLQAIKLDKIDEKKIPEQFVKSLTGPKTSKSRKCRLIAGLYLERAFSKNAKFNREQAKGWYAEAASLGNIGALYHLGKLLLDEKQAEKGQALIKDAARLEDHQAQIFLGWIEDDGRY